MTVDPAWFHDLPDDFEESVRVDRPDPDHRYDAIKSYHLTSDSQRFLGDFVRRLLGRAEDLRTGSNYWLYGYYGSGKSHLLTVLDGLMDSEWLQCQDDVWDALVPKDEQKDSTGLAELREEWEQVHHEYHVIPISVNLLKYQGQKQRSFSEIVLRHAHQNPQLTGVDDDISTGLSAQLDVAYFEDWYRTTEAWPDREERAMAVLDELTGDSSGTSWNTDDLWEDIQEYGALADAVLPELFEEVTGTRDGYSDLRPSDIDPEAVVDRLEKLRREREESLGDPVKLVLLLDEVSLFIGTDFERLTELQTLAENVEEIGEGNIQLVATAQAKIEDVQPRFAAHGADFSIVKDRFPHRYQLPSRHVGEIAKRRLLRKSDAGDAAIRNLLGEAAVKPSESLIYNEIKQNTNPPLDSVDEEELVEFYPFLPYHAPMFLEILFNLRQAAPDPAKSIFSGTARAILALMHGLLQDWIDNGEPDHLVTLVDFYELVKPELRDIPSVSNDVRVVEGAEDDSPNGTRGIADEVDDGELEEFDLDVAKAILLLQHVHDLVPLNEGNIAAAVMSDLNGRAWISTINRVEESLGRLQKFIRPSQEEGGAKYRFATQEERIIYEDAEAKMDAPDWDDILDTVDDHLWQRIVQDLPLPDTVPYGESGDEYPVSYGFSVDGLSLETSHEQEGGLDVTVAIEGVRPDTEAERRSGDVLYWSIDTDGLQDLRNRLVEWWSLRSAISTHEVPPAVKHDLEQRATAVYSKLTSAMKNGTYSVKDRTNISGLSKAVAIAVDVSYPDDFHPVMLQVDEDRLLELRELGPDDPLPAWAQTIQVPSSNQMTDAGSKTIQNNVLVLAGRQLKESDDGLNVTTVIDGIIEEKPFYSETRLALRAILWGFCREGRLLPVDEEGDTLENGAVLDTSGTPTRLKLLDVPNIGKLLEENGFKETTETVAEGLINLRKANERLASRISGLNEDVELVSEADVHTEVVGGLLDSFVEELSDREEAARTRLESIRVQRSGMEDVIEATNEDGDWFEEVLDVWQRRLASLHHLDVILALSDQGFEWIDDDLRSAISEREEAVASFDGVWWTTDGWGSFSQRLVPDIVPDIERSWESFVEDSELDALLQRIDDHPWIVSSRNLPAGVHRAFEREYITPMRRLRQWYETIDEALATLSDDGDTDAIADVSDAMVDLAPLSESVGSKRSEIGDRLDRLSTIVGERSPDNVNQIGVVPDDRPALERRLDRLVESGDLDVEETDAGVIIR